MVEGLAGGRIAIVVKLHHALADGSAAVALLLNIVAAVGEPPGAPPGDGWHPEAIPTWRCTRSGGCATRRSSAATWP